MKLTVQRVLKWITLVVFVYVTVVGFAYVILPTISTALYLIIMGNAEDPNLASQLVLWAPSMLFLTGLVGIFYVKAVLWCIERIKWVFLKWEEKKEGKDE